MISQTLGSTRLPKVAVIGAGLTGLLAAQGLKKNGFEVVVYESEQGLDARSRDWTILLHWAMPALSSLLTEDIKNDLTSAICNPHLDFNEDVECLPVYNGITGDLLFKSPLPGSRRVSRQRLRRVLTTGLDIRWGTSLIQMQFPSGESDASAEESLVHLTFDGGKTETVDYVLAADGANSKVRELLLGPDAARVQHSGFMFATGIADYKDSAKVEAVVKAHPVAAISLGMEAVGGCGVMYVEDKDDVSTWTTFWTKIWRGSQESVPPKDQDALEFIKQNTKNMCEPFQSLVEWTPPGSRCYIDEMKYWVPIHFDNHDGRVAMAGDAAHPMLIYRGQGFQHAVIDATNYVEALVKINDVAGIGERNAIMSSFDTEMIERTAKAVKQSVQEAELSMNMETVGKMLMATQGHGRSA